MVELGFATRGDDEKVKIPEDQLRFMINFDETCLGLALQALVSIRPPNPWMGPITERMSRERIELLVRANTHGKKFFATGGSHVCSDHLFKAQALLAREEEVAEKKKLKKSLQQKAELHKKRMAILVEKAACFESNNYKDVSTKELDILLQLQWYGVDKKGMKQAEKVAQWRAIRASNTEPPQLDMWTAEDKERLPKIANKEIDMSEMFLGWYAAVPKRNAVAAVLDFSAKEWESLKALREADAAETNQTAVANESDNNSGALVTENETIGGESDEV